jgi:hypothetical protein
LAMTTRTFIWLFRFEMLNFRADAPISWPTHSLKQNVASAKMISAGRPVDLGSI